MAYDASPPVEVTARDRVIMLRDHLAKLKPARFDYGWMGTAADAIAGDCGSPACIGGWARAIFRIHTDVRAYVGLAEIGTDWLGLTPDQSACLMFGGPTRFRVRPKHAVAVLDNYLSTGLIDWSRCTALEPQIPEVSR